MLNKNKILSWNLQYVIQVLHLREHNIILI